MSRLTRDGTAEPVSRDQILRRERGQENINFPCSADHEQDWQPYPVDPYSCYMCDHASPNICAVGPVLVLVSNLVYSKTSAFTCTYLFAQQTPTKTLPYYYVAVSSRVSLLISILRLNLVLTYGIPPEFRGGVHLFILNRHTYVIGSFPSSSGHAIAYRWRSLTRVRRHRSSKPQSSSERLLPWQVIMDQLIYASLSHTHYWYEESMLKVPAIIYRNYTAGKTISLAFDLSAEGSIRPFDLAMMLVEGLAPSSTQHK